MYPKFHIKVSSREGSIFEGEVISLSSYNEKGSFDVLSNHTNFITLIKGGLTVREKEGAPEKKLSFDHALMRVKENKVEVYIGVESNAKKTEKASETNL